MASSRKKQDENNLKTLRELGALPQNKFCFDCGQRGPTYVNVTIGSFVCTKCSGILRGLTPPHRVKSISMATFTVEEIDTLRSKGNDYCRKLWLGLYEGNPLVSDEQQVRDFMIEKYERKRYYLEKNMTKPEVPNTRPWSTTPTLNGSNLKLAADGGPKNGIAKREIIHNNNNNNNVPNGIVTNGTTRSRPEVKSHSHNGVNNNLGNSFAVDFDRADIFSNTSTSSTGSTPGSQQNGFADFEHNTVYTANGNGNATTNGMPTASTLNAWASQQAPMNPQNTVFNGAAPKMAHPANNIMDDKYAALKDLDNEMKQQQHQDVWSTSNTGSTGSLYSSSTPTTGSVYGSPSPQGSIFGSPSQGQFMSAFAPVQENTATAQTANPFGINQPTPNPWANANAFCHSTNGTNGFSANGTANGHMNNTNGFSANGVTNGLNGNTNGFNGVHGAQAQQAFVNPFRDQGKPPPNGFSNVLQPIFPSNGMNGMSNGWGGANPFKVGTVTAMNSNNPFL